MPFTKIAKFHARTRRIRFHVPLLRVGCVTIVRNVISTMRDYVLLCVEPGVQRAIHKSAFLCIC